MIVNRAPSLDDPVGSMARFDHAAFFTAICDLGRLRVISRSGASTFEALCTLPRFEFAGGFMNAITETYHWHIALARFGHVRSRDELHARSGRRVLFFELRDSAQMPAFLSIYLHRAPGEPFGQEREARFCLLHTRLARGVELEGPADA